VGYENQVIGTVSLSNVNLMMGLGEIGYMIAQDFQGRGIATKAIRLWTTMLLEKTNLRKLTASVAEQNHASIRVLEKNGYKSEGLLVDHFLINGKPVSQHVFGLLRNQMHHLQEAPSKTKR
jgi:ribosomal-protein-alanine N-acetyltransferase